MNRASRATVVILMLVAAACGGVGVDGIPPDESASEPEPVAPTTTVAATAATPSTPPTSSAPPIPTAPPSAKDAGVPITVQDAGGSGFPWFDDGGFPFWDASIPQIDAGKLKRDGGIHLFDGAIDLDL